MKPKSLRTWTLVGFVAFLLSMSGAMPSAQAAPPVEPSEPAIEPADVEPAPVDVPPPEPTVAAPPAAATEASCDDGLDDDADTVFDCGDADCKDDPVCRASGGSEETEATCGNWLDDDGDGYVDCDDNDCSGTSTCQGSWDLPKSGTKVSTGAVGGPRTLEEAAAADRGDGERDPVTCSDGIDNDADGLVDCEDFGCKLDSSITVCQPPTDFRFSVVARVAQSYDVQENRPDTSFDVLQLRVLGQMPFIQNSFFLISGRFEKTPRLTFAMFQVPLGKKGHYMNINSGGGGLSLTLVQSVHKRLLADPAFYVYNAFEQGNGAAVEFGGPIDKKGKFLYRTFLAGGSGRFAGNIGGTFFPDDNRNYTWSVGAQFWFNIVGYYNRWDSPFLYMPAPLSIALAVGAKYDQRAQERYPAANVQFLLRWKRLQFSAENYTKRELEFQNWQTAYNLQVGVLAWKKRMMVAADFGQYLASEFERDPPQLGYDLRRQLQEMQYRAAVHFYLWRDVFFATLIWRDRRIEPTPAQQQQDQGLQVQQDFRLLFTYRW